jgi:hypothetical protein
MLIATGGTASAAARLIKDAGGEIVECCCGTEALFSRLTASPGARYICGMSSRYHLRIALTGALLGPGLLLRA